MIYNWSLKNFKSVKGKTNLEFKLLTIFAGANSSGKSTVLQSVLLAYQTLISSFSNKSIILNGNVSRFGSFSDILSNGAEERIIELGCELSPAKEFQDNEYYMPYPRFLFSENFEKIRLEFSFTDTLKGKTNEILQLQPKLIRSYVKGEYKDSSDLEVEVLRSEKVIPDKLELLQINEGIVQRSEINSLEYDVKKPSMITSPYWHDRKLAGGKYVGADLNHFLPKLLTIAYDKVETEKSKFVEALVKFEYNPEFQEIFKTYLNKEIKELITGYGEDIIKELGEESFRKFERERFKTALERLKNDFTLDNYRSAVKTSIFGKSFLQKIEEGTYYIKNLIKTNTEKDIRLTTTFNFYPISESVEDFFKRNVKYLGPLRDEPKPVYPLSGTSDPKDIGFKGENTAAVLEVHRNTMVKYIPTKHFSYNLKYKEPEETTLIQAVLDWLEYMGVASKVDTSDKGKLGHELKISTMESSYLHDLTHVGVGVSQVLPILVLSLLANIDSTLIFEQPELHLHPRVQTRLADFFVSLTLLKKQCLVETHSEYLINRLRYQVAISNEDEIAKDIIMYFVEKANQSSVYRKVTINKYGVIDDWPKGFFDESEEIASSILRAGMEKRKTERKR